MSISSSSIFIVLLLVIKEIKIQLKGIVQVHLISEEHISVLIHVFILQLLHIAIFNHKVDGVAIESVFWLPHLDGLPILQVTLPKQLAYRDY